MSTPVVIAGAAESPELGKLPGQSAQLLAASSARLALAQTGLTWADVDGLASTLPTVELASYLGLRPGWLDGTVVGGCSYMLHVRHAVAAIRSGAASVVVVAHGESGRSRVGMAPWKVDPSSMAGQFEQAYGASGTFSRFTLPAMAYLNKYGKSPDDGGGALVVMSAERAADLDLAFRPVTVLGSGESCEGPGASFLEDLTSFAGFREASARAFSESGLRHGDIDHLMIYDAYAHVPLYGLEDLGFVGRGEAIDFIRSGATRPGGALPMNTNGGGLLYTHTGMYGMFAIQEAVRQLRGDAFAPVPGVRTSFVQGIGGMFGAAGSLVLAS
jgi:acetyl-CoA acetyltransferase